ncbi:MAG: hypothetical protein M3313_02190 [Actinomycetota bacterium]|nr:hypothetical protein [Actinomycetota bacterium]
MADVSLIGTTVSAGVGAVAGLLAAAGKSYLDSRRKIDEDLRGRRAPAYQALWELTQLFQLWPRKEVSYADASHLHEELSNWYYMNGGLYLSRKSQRAYQNLQKALANLHTQPRAGPSTNVMSSEDWQAVRTNCSRLRSSLTDDLLSRRSGKRL